MRAVFADAEKTHLKDRCLRHRRKHLNRVAGDAFQNAKPLKLLSQETPEQQIFLVEMLEDPKMLNA